MIEVWWTNGRNIGVRSSVGTSLFETIDDAIRFGEELTSIARGMKEMACPECGAMLDYSRPMGHVIYESCSACGYRREKFGREQKDSVPNKDTLQQQISDLSETVTRHGRLIEALGESGIDERLSECIAKLESHARYERKRVTDLANTLEGRVTRHETICDALEKRISDLEAMTQPVCRDCSSSGLCGLEPLLKCSNFKHVDNAFAGES